MNPSRLSSLFLAVIAVVVFLALLFPLSSAGWSETEVFSPEAASNSLSPSIAVGPGNVLNVVWQDNTNYLGSGYDYDIFYKMFDIIAPKADAGSDLISSEGVTVTFDGSASTDNVAIVNYTWNFTYDGDTVMFYGAVLTLDFDIPGNYNVTLNVSDAVGN